MKRIILLTSLFFIPIFTVDLPKVYGPKDAQRIREILQELKAKNLEQGVVKVKELKKPAPNYDKLLEALDTKSLPDALKKVADLKTKNAQINEAFGKQQKEIYTLKEENISLKNKLAELSQKPGVPTPPPLPPATAPKDRPYLEDIKTGRPLKPVKPIEKEPTDREKLLEQIQTGKKLKETKPQQPVTKPTEPGSLEDTLKRAMESRRGSIAEDNNQNSDSSDDEWN